MMLSSEVISQGVVSDPFCEAAFAQVTESTQRGFIATKGDDPQKDTKKH
jgi:hypothetical protein